ncbi:MAG: type II secretion system protein [Magnetococcales bacterium]|nr:type II secretion system protein [Magnetococcales bacterium]
MRDPGSLNIRSFPSNQSGFSLVGMALAMILLGIVVSTVGYLFPRYADFLREKNTQHLQADLQALIGFAATHGQLPPTQINGIPQTYTNVIPQPRDAYNAPIHYLYDPQLSHPGSLCAASSTPIRVINQATVENVAFVLWSSGYDGRMHPVKGTGAVATEGETIVIPTYAQGRDDGVLWATLERLQAAAHCSG